MHLAAEVNALAVRPLPGFQVAEEARSLFRPGVVHDMDDHIRRFRVLHLGSVRLRAAIPLFLCSRIKKSHLVVVFKGE